MNFNQNKLTKNESLAKVVGIWRMDGLPRCSCLDLCTGRILSPSSAGQERVPLHERHGSTSFPSLVQSSYCSWADPISRGVGTPLSQSSPDALSLSSKCLVITTPCSPVDVLRMFPSRKQNSAPRRAHTPAGKPTINQIRCVVLRVVESARKQEAGKEGVGVRVERL